MTTPELLEALVPIATELERLGVPYYVASIDIAYLRRWAGALAVSDLLGRALDDSGLA